MKCLYIVLFYLLSFPCLADVVVPTRTIRADAIITEMDVRLESAKVPDVFEKLRDVIGQEARIVLYAGRPIFLDDIGPPAIINRNQIVGLIFEGSGIRIMTDGRALERAGVGDYVRVMNLSSRTTIIGQANSDGTIQILK